MKPKPAPVHGEKKKVLIVDDDPHVMEVLSNLLQQANYEVIEATYSLPALFSAARSVPDLMLVDIRMPIMNGLELIEQFKSFEETRNVPIVAITGLDTQEMRNAASKLGCVGFIPKPFDAKEFPGKIAAFLNASPATAENRK
jgi:CheY-like chemotaxis protein